jgi:hypothetical protein
MRTSELSSTQRLRVHCFKCSEGCLHLEYGNLTFTFSPEQFLAFSEVITESRRLLLEERDAKAESFMPADAFVM